MTQDESAIREVVEDWFTTTKSGSLPTALDLMTDDIIFMLPGQPPSSKKEFAAASEGMKNLRIDGTYDIQEVQVLGNWAHLHNHIRTTVTPPDGSPPMYRPGYTLTILRKDLGGRWRLTRDANLLAAETAATP